MKKPTLSPTRISTFLACPVKYRWTYIDPRGKLYMRAKSTYSFGLTLHKVLELFHDSEESGVSTTAEAVAAYEENWIEAGFSDPEEMAEAYGEGLAILQRHTEEAARIKVTSKTLFVEKTLRYEFEHFALIGRIDRLDEHEDGSLEIIDYKSGRETVRPEHVAGDLAMACYQLLVAKNYPGRPVRASIIALRSGESATASLSQSELDEFEGDLAVLGAEIVTIDDFYERLPKLKALCRHCDFLPLCKKSEEFAEALAAG